MLKEDSVIQNEDEDIYDYPREFDDVEIHGTEYINKCYVIDQQPIGRAKTSNIATYTGVFDVIRKYLITPLFLRNFNTMTTKKHYIWGKYVFMNKIPQI